MRNKKIALMLVALLLLMGAALAGCGGDVEIDSSDPGLEQSDEEDKLGEEGDEDNLEENKPEEESSSNERGESATEALKSYEAKLSKISSVSFAQVFTFSNGETFVHDLWVKGSKIRTEMEDSDSGEPMVVLIDTKSGFSHVYYPESNQAIKVDFDGKALADDISLEVFDKSLAFSALSFKEKDVYDDKKCAVFEGEEEDGSLLTVWIWEEKGVPLKLTTMEGEAFKTLEYKNFEFNSVKDEMFELPRDTEIFDYTEAAG